VDVHDCFGDTERTADKQLECSELFFAETTFSRPQSDCVRHRSIAEKPRRLGRGKSGEVSHDVLLGHARRISVIRRRLSDSQHRAQKQHRTRNFFVERVEKPTDNSSARPLCCYMADR
jgi:hypothetical protein